MHTLTLFLANSVSDTDQVTMSPQLVIKDQSIGVATEANDMNGMDGILGECFLLSYPSILVYVSY